MAKWVETAAQIPKTITVRAAAAPAGKIRNSRRFIRSPMYKRPRYQFLILVAWGCCIAIRRRVRQLMWSQGGDGCQMIEVPQKADRITLPPMPSGVCQKLP